MRAKTFISGHQLLFSGLFVVVTTLAVMFAFALPKPSFTRIEFLMMGWDMEHFQEFREHGVFHFPEKEVALKFVIGRDGYYLYALNNMYSKDRTPSPSLQHLNACQFRQRMSIFHQHCPYVPIVFSLMPDVRYQRFVDVLNYCRYYRVWKYRVEKISEEEMRAVECFSGRKALPCDAPVIHIPAQRM